MIILAHLERWLSGRKRQIANLLIGLDLSEGSNPSLSVQTLAVLQGYLYCWTLTASTLAGTV